MPFTEPDVDPGLSQGRGRMKNQRGAALLFAISVLAIFSTLGMLYVRHMELELADADINLREKRARQLAAAGVECAAAGLQQFVLNPAKRPVELGKPYVVELPTYRSIVTGESGVEAPPMGAPRLAEITFAIYDESGKINLNHAPASVLQQVMDVPGDVARTIAASVPRLPGTKNASWFLELDQLVARELVNPAEVDLDALGNLITTYSVLDHADPAGYLNVNVAAPEVLGPVLDLTPEQASQVVAQGPFAGADALAKAVAEARGAPVDTVTLDDSLGFQSRCFRVVCQGRYARFVNEALYRESSAEDKRSFLMNVAVSRVEAVLLFAPDGSYEVIHWNVDASSPA